MMSVLSYGACRIPFNCDEDRLANKTSILETDSRGANDIHMLKILFRYVCGKCGAIIVGP